MNGFIGVWIVMLSLNFVKAVTIGSEFDLIQWWKYGKNYTRWYFHRQTWREYCIEHPTPTRKEATP